MSCDIAVSLSVRIMFFIVKQKTAYEMRISDWSSYVCSSDLLERHRFIGAHCRNKFIHELFGRHIKDCRVRMFGGKGSSDRVEQMRFALSCCSMQEQRIEARPFALCHAFRRMEGQAV